MRVKEDKCVQKHNKIKHARDKIAIFLAFEIIFTALSFPLMIFYGPFENVKKLTVGSFMTTRRFPFIAKMFLSDAAIENIVGKCVAVDPTWNGEAIQKLDFVIDPADKAIDQYTINGGDFVGKALVVHNPRRVVVGYSSQMPKAGETTSTIAKKAGAVAAINGGGFVDENWTGTGGEPTGIMFHNSQLLYDQLKNDEAPQDTAGFTKDGMLIVGKHSIKQLKGYGIKEAITFGPALIVNGKPTITEGDGGAGFAPRTAIGQKADGSVVLLVIDGRDPLKGILGATLRDVQDILLKQFKCVNAVNLDGGSSTTMYYDGKVINKPSDGLGERAVPTAFLVMP